MSTLKNKDAREIGAEWLCKQAFDQLGIGSFLWQAGWEEEKISLASTVYHLLIPYKEHVLTITSDKGTEFAEHQAIAKNLNTEFYFAHP